MAVPATPWMRRVPHRPVPAIPTPSPSPQPSPVPPPPRPAPPPPAAPDPPAPAPTTGLTRLTRTAPEPSAPARTEPTGPALLLLPPPGVAATATLDVDDPVVRLDALQSAIGVLTIRGAERVAWEDVADHAGVVAPGSSSTGDDVPQPGNRPLVQVFEGAVIVTLRHVRALRRLLVDAPPDTSVSASAHVSGVVRTADPALRSRMSVVVVDGRLELRAEFGLPDDWRAALAAMGWSPLATIPSAR